MTRRYLGVVLKTERRVSIIELRAWCVLDRDGGERETGRGEVSVRCGGLAQTTTGNNISSKYYHRLTSFHRAMNMEKFHEVYEPAVRCVRSDGER